MTLASLSLPDLIGVFLGFIFTLLVFSYLLGDNPLFRLTIHIFIGVTAGLVAAVLYYNVILNQLVFPLLTNPAASLYLVVPPLILSVWLLIKIFPKLARLGNPVIAYLVGAGAATAVGGATLGTIFPQVGATTSLFNLSAGQPGAASSSITLIKGIVVLVGVVTTLVYFQFGVKPGPDQVLRRPRWVDQVGWVGMIFIAITFGSLFAGVYAASLTALIERLRFLLDTILLVLPIR